MMNSHHIGRRAGLLTFLKAHRRSLIMLALLLLFLYAIMPQVAGLGQSFQVISQANFLYIALAFLSWCVIYILAVALYMILALHPLSFRRTLEAQIASGFTGKLLPSGLGVVGLFVQYLRNQRHTLSEAVAVASVNNLAAIAGHICLLLIFFAAGTPLPDIDVASVMPSVSSLWAVAAGMLVVTLLSIILRGRIARAWQTIIKTLAVYREHPGRVIAAVLVSVPQTFAYIGVLYASSLALGVHLDGNVIFMVATFSMLVGTLIPVPGGIVGAEAGLTAGFVAYGLTVQQGLAIALLYRAFIYWLPIIPGLLIFAYRRRDYM